MGHCSVRLGCRTLWKIADYICITLLVFITCGVSATLAASLNNYHVRSDGCDWNGSGLERDNSRDVEPVYVRCREGRIRWHYPKGALRVVLTQRRNFEACFLLRENTARASLHVEGAAALRPLFVDGRPVACYAARNGRLAVFVEADVAHSPLSKTVVDFSYDLQVDTDKPHDDCRPCTEKELLRHFCTADFVARGSVSDMTHVTPLQRTELTVMATHVLRDIQQKTFNSSEDGGIARAVLHRPLECGTKIGQGDFLFLGRWKLGNPTITCAPRWRQWKKVKQKAIQSQSYDCVLD